MLYCAENRDHPNIGERCDAPYPSIGATSNGSKNNSSLASVFLVWESNLTLHTVKTVGFPVAGGYKTAKENGHC